MGLKEVNIGIVGGAGYTAGELVRILLHHPFAKINTITSTSSAGKPIYTVHDDLLGQTNLSFTKDLTGKEDVIFLCLGHGNSKVFLEKNKLDPGTKIIDLSNDFRLQNHASLQGMNFVYGLPELQRDKIQEASYIANPGCFATAIELALLPLAKNNFLKDSIHVSAITGSTGAGQNLSSTTHFSWRSDNVSIYKAFTHQHLGEIKQSLDQLQPSFKKDVHFIPYRGNFTRGIFASCYTFYDGEISHAKELYQDFYNTHPFVFISDEDVHLKQVVGTNNCFLHLQKEGDMLLITSVIDNLVKGAAGQATQNMNLMFDFPENAGLELRSLQF